MKIPLIPATVFVLLVCSVAVLSFQSVQPKDPARYDWAVYGGAPENSHYSPLTQINRTNVKQLKMAWSFDTRERGGLQTSPLVVDGVVYGITPSQKIFALDGITGKRLWKFDSGIKGTQPDRGLAYWSDGKDRRILVGVMNYLYALDAKTGKPIRSFGQDGRIDLRGGLGRDPKSQFVALTTPGIIYKDEIIVGGRNEETLPAAPGDVRAYDVRTGKMRWTFHTIPHPGELGYDTWPKDAWTYIGAANNWGGMAVDPKRGIVFVPTGSAASDFYGGNRDGDNLFADCLIALNAETGERIWHFQAVKHDIWDRDFPTGPLLVTVKHDGKNIDAIAQPSKQGFVYLLDRVTGESLFPIEYHEYPKSDVPGEITAPKQGLPTKPAPYARQALTEDMLTNRTPEAHRAVLDEFRKFRNGGQFLPFGVGVDTIIFPGFDGGAEWGGSAVDPETGIIYINSNENAWKAGLVETARGNGSKDLYMSQCAVCHGDKLAGSPPNFPSLIGIGTRMKAKKIAETIRTGKGRMPGFPNFKDDQMSALVDFLVSDVNKELTGSGPSPADLKYEFTGYRRFVDPEGYPAIAPPWGTLNAIDLNTGEYAWKINFGEYPELAAKGMKNTGTDNYGGPVVTAGGLLFIGATNYDKKFHVYDKATGELLWETTLPFAGNATPAIYATNGREYIVIAAGGGKDFRSPSGGIYVAFALP